MSVLLLLNDLFLNEKNMTMQDQEMADEIKNSKEAKCF